MSLNNNALLTVDEYLIYQGESDNVDAQRTAQIELGINWASTEIDTYLNRTLLPTAAESTISEIFDGLGIVHYNISHDTHVTQQAPLKFTPAPVLSIRSGGSWVAIDTTLYSSGSAEGTIYFTDGDLFIQGRKNYKIDYVYGYDSISSIPADIKWATAMTVKHFENMAKHQGKSSMTIENQTFGFNQNIPKTATNILDRYKR